MKEIFLLYSCDAWHSYDSMELFAVFTDRKKLKSFLGRMKFRRKISQEQYEELLTGGQTQGLETNYFMETKEANPQFDKVYNS